MKANSDNLSFEENRVGESEEMIYQKEIENIFLLCVVDLGEHILILDDL